MAGAVGDINYDGLVDAVVGADDANVYVFLNSGGTFPSRSSVVPMPTSPTTYVALTDMSGDGYLDLVGLSSSLSVANGTATGTFGSATNVTSSNGGYTLVNTYGAYVSISDFNGDGILDMVGIAGQGVNVQIGQGAKAYRTMDLPWAANWQNIATGDMNGDGKQDILASTSSQNKIGVFVQSGCR